MALTVQLIEPYGYARAGLIRMLQSEGLEPAPTDPTAAEAATHADGTDVTIIGLSLEREAGLKAARSVNNACPDHPVLLLLSPGETALGEQALRDGARGYLLLSQSGEEIAAACRAVVDGQIYRPSPPDANA